jgi:hypothetical protein
VSGRTPAEGPPPPADGAEPDDGDFDEEFFDPSFLADLEGLAQLEKGALPTPLSLSSGLSEKLAAFVAPLEPGAVELNENAFVELPGSGLVERLNTLVEICRGGGRLQAVQPVENFIVFFQALAPTVAEEGARQIKRFFFHLVPTLIHIAYNDFSARDDKREEGKLALRNLETILIEISNVRLTPGESDLVFRNIDQMAAFIAVGEYTMANEVISAQLLQIIRGNKLTRALFRLMEVEVSVQLYLKERLGYLTPKIRVPEDITTLTDYGPIRILEEEVLGEPKIFIQVHIPEIPFLRDIVLRLVADDETAYDLRLDAVGSAELNLPPGLYGLGLVYQP